MPRTLAEVQERILANLTARTGKTLEQWSRFAVKAGPASRKERVGWLMKEHGLGRVAASLIAAHAEGRAPDYRNTAALLDGMFAGPKAELRPVYDALIRAARSLGKDVEVIPCQTQVTLRRRRQFAWIKPSTRTRIDLGLALPGVSAGGQLVEIAGADAQDRVRLRIPIASKAGVDEEVRRWLKTAYDFNA
jgi:Domain of unknown function (DUF5655)/Domain of unknown function (DUF4287)